MAEHAERRWRRALLTPEGVDLGVRLADAGQRASAFLLDALFLLLAMTALTIVALIGLVGQVRVRAEAVGVIWLLGFFLIRNGYFIACELRPRSATWGKRIIGLRVTARDGGRLTADAVIARNLMREIEVFLPLTFLLAGRGQAPRESWIGVSGLAWATIFLLFPLFNRDRLRVGDLLAGTWVIHAPRRVLLPEIGAAAADPRYAFTDAQLDAYGAFELATLETVLRTMGGDARGAVAQSIAGRIGWTSPIGDVDVFLEAYYQALRRRLEKSLLFGDVKQDKFDES